MHALVQSAKAHAGGLGKCGLLLFRDALTPVFNFDPQFIAGGYQSYGARLAAGMPANIAQALLHHTENCKLDIIPEPWEGFGNLEINLDSAAVGKPVHIPAQR